MASERKDDKQSYNLFKRNNMTEEKFISVDSGGNRNGGWNPADFAALMGNNRSGLFGGNGIWDGVLGLFGLGLVANMFPGFIGGNRGGNSGNDQAAAAHLIVAMRTCVMEKVVASIRMAEPTIVTKEIGKSVRSCASRMSVKSKNWSTNFSTENAQG